MTVESGRCFARNSQVQILSVAPSIENVPDKGSTRVLLTPGPALTVFRSPALITWPTSWSRPSPQEPEVRVRIPAWASKAEQKRNEDPVVLCDWVDSSETLYLKDGVNLPLDRSGTIVFENGLVVLSSSGSPRMFTVDEGVVELVEEWRELNLEMLRDSV